MDHRMMGPCQDPREKAWDSNTDSGACPTDQANYVEACMRLSLDPFATITASRMEAYCELGYARHMEH